MYVIKSIVLLLEDLTIKYELSPPQNLCTIVCVFRVFYCTDPINYRRKLELFKKGCFFWVIGLQNYSEQLAASSTLPISYYLVLYDMVFLNKAINNKYYLNLSTYICFSKSSKDLRSSKHQQLLPVKRCRKLSTRESFFQRVCGYSNLLATREIDVFDSPEKFKQELMTYICNQVPTFNLDRTCSWFIKLL